MIDASMRNPFVIMLVFNLVMIFGAWLYYNLRDAQATSVIKSNLYRCVKCSHVYVEGREVPLSQCPRCGHFNEAVKR